MKHLMEINRKIRLDRIQEIKDAMSEKRSPQVDRIIFYAAVIPAISYFLAHLVIYIVRTI